MVTPASLLAEFAGLLLDENLPGPVLDLACGDGHNGIYLAAKGLQVVCCDKSWDDLDKAGRTAAENGVRIGIWQVDLEVEGVNPLPEAAFGAILVFRYLHRPLFPCIRKALNPGGILVYETFTDEQAQFGKPKNPDHLLRAGELPASFSDWLILHRFEGIRTDPMRAIAQIVCRKPYSARV